MDHSAAFCDCFARPVSRHKRPCLPRNLRSGPPIRASVRRRALGQRRNCWSWDGPTHENGHFRFRRETAPLRGSIASEDVSSAADFTVLAHQKLWSCHGFVAIRCVQRRFVGVKCGGAMKFISFIERRQQGRVVGRLHQGRRRIKISIRSAVLPFSGGRTHWGSRPIRRTDSQGAVN